jgi:hypothetical protein
MSGSSRTSKSSRGESRHLLTPAVNRGRYKPEGWMCLCERVAPGVRLNDFPGTEFKGFRGLRSRALATRGVTTRGVRLIIVHWIAPVAPVPVPPGWTALENSASPSGAPFALLGCPYCLHRVPCFRPASRALGLSRALARWLALPPSQWFRSGLSADPSAL